MELNKIYQTDCLELMNQLENNINLIITSPPYNIGKEYESKMPLNEYLCWQKALIHKFHEVLSEDGSICYQVGNYIDQDTKSVYPLDCLLFPYFIEAGFIPRNRIVWHFEHGQHCKNRLSGRHETIMWFTKSKKYTFNLDAIRVPQKYPQKKHYKGPKKGQLSGNPLGKNPGDVWAIPNVKNNHPEKTKHPCQFPLSLINRLIKAFSLPGDIVFDPFMGSGTTAIACLDNDRFYLGSEIDPEYSKIHTERIANHSNQLRLL